MIREYLFHVHTLSQTSELSWRWENRKDGKSSCRGEVVLLGIGFGAYQQFLGKGIDR